MTARPKQNGECRLRLSAVIVSARLEKTLSAYAASAISAGVTLAALSPCAQAKIIYTSANTEIPLNGGSVVLDLNHDGITDFSFSNATWAGPRSGGLLLGARPANESNAIWGRGQFGFSFAGFSGVFASALHAGFAIRPSKPYLQKSNRWLMGFYDRSLYVSRTSGQWLYTQDRYLGLKFVISGQTHYGWARLTVALPAVGYREIKATLTGYAYETIPNKPIIAGKTKGPDVIKWEPATLGRLAQGASGISAWREKK